MVSNQSVSNEDAVVRNADTAQPTPDFNGAMFNEINYANQNVSMNYDMKGGFDTADYFVVGAGKGLDVQIGKDTVTVEKSFTTREQVAQDVVTDGVTSQQMVTQLKAHTATDTWRNTEGINGTGSDDNFNISDLSGIRNIDGRDLPAKADGTAHAENDTLTLDPSMGPVSWHFNRDEAGNIDRKNGYVTNGTDRVDFKNIETVATRDGDIVDGVRQGVAPAPDPALDATPGAMQSSKTVTESLAAVDGEFSDVQALIAARAAAGTTSTSSAS